MALFNRIVVGTDGSDTANEAVRQAVELAGLTGAHLDVVTAYQPASSRRTDAEGGSAPGDVQHEFGPREDATFVLDGAVGTAKTAGLEVTPHALEGDPGDAILDVAEQVGADLVVVGNKGMSGAKRFILGSVPNKISHHAPCSVIIVQTS